eukprot:8761400-Pyramimonas_sp.AAC.1
MILLSPGVFRRFPPPWGPMSAPMAIKSEPGRENYPGGGVGNTGAAHEQKKHIFRCPGLLAGETPA